ncbi:MerR family transcriptional regulator [Pelosinus sp. sgz500959]|uniref:helix-turn-helix domain-containing protein n=1 Tax=Pelosinus sp. sgz500959 TaxID=3242472 RepID=UPI00366F0493
MTYKIEEVAKQTGLTKRALRYYEELGLIQPSTRTDGGYRLYSEEDITQIKYVKMSRELLGVSLGELKEYIDLEKQTEILRRDYWRTDNKEQTQALERLEQAINQQRLFLLQKIKSMNQIVEVFNEKLERIAKKKQQLHNEVLTNGQE